MNDDDQQTSNITRQRETVHHLVKCNTRLLLHLIIIIIIISYGSVSVSDSDKV